MRHASPYVARCGTHPIMAPSPWGVSVVVTEWQLDLDAGVDVAAEGQVDRPRAGDAGRGRLDERGFSGRGGFHEVRVMRVRSWSNPIDWDPTDEGPIEP